MKTVLAKSSIMTILVLAAALPAAAESTSGGPPQLAKQLLPAKGGGRLFVTSEALASGQALDERFTQNGENRSPPVSWTKGPTGTVSYAILLEDASVNRPEPVTHWLVYDIPSTVTRVAENQPKQAEISSGAEQGLNVRKEIGFIGPKPPAGETHNYHVQVFALNTRLKLDPAETDRDDMIKAMKGRVLASGDLVVSYTGK